MCRWSIRIGLKCSSRCVFHRQLPSASVFSLGLVVIDGDSGDDYTQRFDVPVLTMNYCAQEPHHSSTLEFFQTRSRTPRHSASRLNGLIPPTHRSSLIDTQTFTRPSLKSTKHACSIVTVSRGLHDQHPPPLTPSNDRNAARQCPSTSLFQ